MSVELQTSLNMNCALNKLTVVVGERTWQSQCFYRSLSNIREIFRVSR